MAREGAWHNSQGKEQGDKLVSKKMNRKETREVLQTFLMLQLLKQAK